MQLVSLLLYICTLKCLCLCLSKDKLKANLYQSIPSIQFHLYISQSIYLSSYLRNRASNVNLFSACFNFTHFCAISASFIAVVVIIANIVFVVFVVPVVATTAALESHIQPQFSPFPFHFFPFIRYLQSFSGYQTLRVLLEYQYTKANINICILIR